MKSVQVLIVDDSVVMRLMLTEALSEQPGIEVAGTASNGKLAIQRCEQLKPDIVTLDLEMPEMDGMTAITRLREIRPDIRILICSSLSRRGAEITLEALRLGAHDYITKPSTGLSAAENVDLLRHDLLPRIRQFFPSGERQQKSHVAPPSLKPKWPGLKTAAILAIGVSTGGPTALAEIIPQFPAGFPLPVVIVQHMPPSFTASLADRLQRISAIEVSEAKDGDPVLPGKALIAPGGFHMKLVKHGEKILASLNTDPPENSCRPAVDVLFRSVAELYPGKALGAILTGMGSDGAKGLLAMKQAGAYVVAQDEKSCVVWGMPGEAVRLGVADKVLPLHAIVPDLLEKISETRFPAWK